MPNISKVNVDGVLYDLAADVSVFVINLVNNYNQYTSDKTFDEIQDAFSEQQSIILILNTVVYTLQECTSEQITFCSVDVRIDNHVNYTTVYTASLSSEDVWTLYSTALDTVLSEDLYLYVDRANGLDTNTGTESSPLKTIQAAVNRIPKNLGIHFVEINIARGTYNENVTIYNFIGSHTSGIGIYGFDEQNTVIADSVKISDCSIGIQIGTLTISASSSSCLDTASVKNLELYNVTFTGDNGADTGVSVDTGFHRVTPVQIGSCTFNNLNVGFECGAGTSFVRLSYFNNVRFALSARSGAAIIGQSGNLFGNVEYEYIGPKLYEIYDSTEDGDIVFE